MGYSLLIYKEVVKLQEEYIRIIKKGSLTLIHRATAAGHVGYIVNES